MEKIRDGTLNSKLKIVNIVMAGKVLLDKKLSDQHINELSKLGWKATNEQKGTVLVAKLDRVSLCLSTSGCLFIQGCKSKKQGQEAYLKVIADLRYLKSKVLSDTSSN